MKPKSHSWRRYLLAVPSLFIAAQTLAATPDATTSATRLGLKPGLWNVELTYQSLDGRQVLNSQDLFARLLASVNPTDLALDRVDTALAQSGCANGSGEGVFLQRAEQSNTQNTRAMPQCTLPLAMRMQSEAALNESGANEGASSSFRICLTAAMAERQLPILDAHDSCHPDHVHQEGKRENFAFSCNTTGTLLSGKGESRRTLLGHILTLTDFTATINSKVTYAVHDRTEMKYLRPDCNSLKPNG
jgi:hypothetical protein